MFQCIYSNPYSSRFEIHIAFSTEFHSNEQMKKKTNAIQSHHLFIHTDPANTTRDNHFILTDDAVSQFLSIPTFLFLDGVTSAVRVKRQNLRRVRRHLQKQRKEKRRNKENWKSPDARRHPVKYSHWSNRTQTTHTRPVQPPQSSSSHCALFKSHFATHRCVLNTPPV